MDLQRTVQKVNSKPYRSRKIGRPKLRWENGVLQDIRALDQELEGYGYEKGGMAKTSAEGQGPPWAVEPVTMMIFLPLRCME
jgi:hypothetical protein